MFRFALLTLVLFLLPGPAWAHCDGMDGPVVKAAQKALQTGNVSLVLIWVQPKDEAEIRQAFEKTMAVRQVSAQVKDLADRYFFETLVRVHRAGEGAPYDGLKPAGRDLGPAIPAADKAVESGSPEELLKLLTGAVSTGVRDRFAEARAKKNFAANRVEAGREYIKAYVELLHYAEGIYRATQGLGHREPE